MNPYGSVFVRAETGRYGESIDCLEGTIDFADTVDRVLEPRAPEPDVRIPTPVAAGAAPTGAHRAGGLGRAATRSCTEPAAPFAIVPAAVAPAPPGSGRRSAPAPAPVARRPARRPCARWPSSRASSSSALGCAGAACAGTVQVSDERRYKVGKTKKLRRR